MKNKNIFFQDCHLAGRKYYDVDEVWNKLQVGTKLRMERDTNNRFDEYAIAVMFDNFDTNGNHEEYMLGYLPANKNKLIATFMDMGWNNCFSCNISAIKPYEDYEEQIQLSIKICRNKEL